MTRLAALLMVAGTALLLASLPSLIHGGYLVGAVQFALGLVALMLGWVLL